MTWEPVTIQGLYKFILQAERALSGEMLSFWESIKIAPEKWHEQTHGVEGGGFWVVGIIGRKVIYYNDIEDGFNVSGYKNYGTIETYTCNQDELILTIGRLFEQTNRHNI